MKKVYKRPFVEGVEVSMCYGVMIGPSGEIDPTHGMAKKQDLVIEEDEEEQEEAAATPKFFHSNDYLKKVWD